MVLMGQAEAEANYWWLNCDLSQAGSSLGSSRHLFILLGDLSNLSLSLPNLFCYSDDGG